MLEPMRYCITMTNDHIAKVPHCPELLEKIWAVRG
jgi:hypothetical protein